jgi:hypothetical protein
MKRAGINKCNLLKNLCGSDFSCSRTTINELEGNRYLENKS